MKVDFSKCIFLSVEMQKIILLMYRNGNTVNYKLQNIYGNERAFQKAMGILIEAGAIDIFINDDYYNEYILTSTGKFLCKSNIIPLKESQ